MKKELANRSAIVTGGAQGIGRGIALQLAKAVSNIVIDDLDTENAWLVAEGISSMGVKTGTQDDITAQLSSQRSRTTAKKPTSTLQGRLLAEGVANTVLIFLPGHISDIASQALNLNCVKKVS